MNFNSCWLAESVHPSTSAYVYKFFTTCSGKITRLIGKYVSKLISESSGGATMVTSRAVENFNTAVRPEASLPAGLAQSVPDLQVGRLPGIATAMPAEFRTPVITGIYEDNPVGPAVPDHHQWDIPQLNGHNFGHGPDIMEFPD
jgi:hypothetical protein